MIPANKTMTSQSKRDMEDMVAELRDGKWYYADDTVIPAIMGGNGEDEDFGTVTLDDTNLIFGDQGPDTVLPGQIIWRADGSRFQVQEIREDGLVKVAAQLPGGTAGTTVLQPGTYATEGGKVLDVAEGGKISGTRTMSSSEREQFNLPFSLGGNGTGNGGGGGGGGGVGLDPIQRAEIQSRTRLNAAQVAFDYYDRLLEQGIYTAERAEREWQRAFDVISTNKDIEVTNANNLVSVAIENARLEEGQQDRALDAAIEEERARREREIEESRRQRELAQISTQRATSAAQNILPFAVPGMSSMDIPLLGNVPTSQVNLDQFFSQGLPPLAAQPGISPDPSVPFPVGQAPQVGAPPQVSPIDQSQLPPIPQVQFPAIPQV